MGEGDSVPGKQRACCPFAETMGHGILAADIRTPPQQQINHWRGGIPPPLGSATDRRTPATTLKLPHPKMSGKLSPPMFHSTNLYIKMGTRHAARPESKATPRTLFTVTTDSDIFLVFFLQRLLHTLLLWRCRWQWNAGQLWHAALAVQ
jgi:hypothetical protein